MDRNEPTQNLVGGLYEHGDKGSNYIKAKNHLASREIINFQEKLHIARLGNWKPYMQWVTYTPKPTY